MCSSWLSSRKSFFPAAHNSERQTRTQRTGICWARLSEWLQETQRWRQSETFMVNSPQANGRPRRSRWAGKLQISKFVTVCCCELMVRNLWAASLSDQCAAAKLPQGCSEKVKQQTESIATATQKMLKKFACHPQTKTKRRKVAAVWSHNKKNKHAWRFSSCSSEFETWLQGEINALNVRLYIYLVIISRKI